jgi:hypothetical protein
VRFLKAIALCVLSLQLVLSALFCTKALPMTHVEFGAFVNVITSVPFVVTGVAGVLRSRCGLIRCAPGLYFAVGFSFILVGLGSCFYHWSPSLNHLLWDRLPIALSLAAIASAVTDIRWKGLGTVLLCPAIAVAVFAVLYWYETSSRGHEDIRPWAFVQVAAVIWIAAAALPAASPIDHAMRTILGVYAGGRICEFFEQTIYRYAGFDLGHPIKHLLLAWAALLILRALRPKPLLDGF